MKLVFNPSANTQIKNPKYPDVLSVKEVREILEISRISVYNLIGSHQIDAFRIGRIYMIPKTSLEKFLQENGGD